MQRRPEVAVARRAPGIELRRRARARRRRRSACPVASSATPSCECASASSGRSSAPFGARRSRPARRRGAAARARARRTRARTRAPPSPRARARSAAAATSRVALRGRVVERHVDASRCARARARRAAAARPAGARRRSASARPARSPSFERVVAGGELAVAEPDRRRPRRGQRRGRRGVGDGGGSARGRGRESQVGARPGPSARHGRRGVGRDRSARRGRRRRAPPAPRRGGRTRRTPSATAEQRTQRHALIAVVSCLFTTAHACAMTSRAASSTVSCVRGVRRTTTSPVGASRVEHRAARGPHRLGHALVLRQRLRGARRSCAPTPSSGSTMQRPVERHPRRALHAGGPRARVASRVRRLRALQLAERRADPLVRRELAEPVARDRARTRPCARLASTRASRAQVPRRVLLAVVAEHHRLALGDRSCTFTGRFHTRTRLRMTSFA